MQQLSVNPSSSKNMQTYSSIPNQFALRAAAIKLRAPIQGEFGFGTMDDQILYIDKVCAEKKDPTWFFGLEDYMDQSIWVDLETDEKLLIHIGKVIKDGSYPIDDLELGCTNLSTFASNKPETDKIGLRRFKSALGELDSMSDVGISPMVTTVKTDPDSFAKEMRSRINIDCYQRFNELFSYYVKSREDGDNSVYIERPYVKKLYEEVFSRKPQIRSSKDQDDAKAAIYNELSVQSNNYDGSINVDKIFELADAEIIELAEQLDFLPRIIDGRSLIEASLEHRHKKALKPGDVLYLGRLDEETQKLPKQMLLVPIKDSGNGIEYDSMNIEFKFSHDMSKFNATVTGPIEDSKTSKSTSYNSAYRSSYNYGAVSRNTKKIDVFQAQAFMNRIQSLYPNNQGNIPGYLVNVESNKIINITNEALRLFPTGTRYCTFAFFSDAKEVEPWINKVTAQVECKPIGDVSENIRLSPNFKTQLTWTKKDLPQIARYASLVSEKGGDSKIQIPRAGLRKPDMIASVSEGVEVLYNKLEAPLKLAIRIMLGAYDMDRPYLVLRKTSVSSHPPHPTDSVVDNKPPQIKKEQYVCMTKNLLVAATKLHVLHGDDALDKAQELIYKTKKGGIISKVKKAFQPPQVGGIASKQHESALAPLYKYADGFDDEIIKDYMDPTDLEKYDILQFLAEIAIQNVVHNETVISFDDNSNRVARPRDYVESILDNGQYNYVTISKSIYAKEPV